MRHICLWALLICLPLLTGCQILDGIIDKEREIGPHEQTAWGGGPMKGFGMPFGGPKTEK